VNNPGMGTRNREIFNRPTQTERRKELRQSLTPAEAVLWKKLQRRQVLDRKFRRQEGIGPYIVDFYCAECKLVVELDGARHFGFVTPEYDANRTRYLERLGLRVIRFENKRVKEDIDGVLKTIRDVIGERLGD